MVNRQKTHAFAAWVLEKLEENQQIWKISNFCHGYPKKSSRTAAA
jgi:hypothetical protein